MKKPGLRGIQNKIKVENRNAQIFNQHLPHFKDNVACILIQNTELGNKQIFLKEFLEGEERQQDK